MQTGDDPAVSSGETLPEVPANLPGRWQAQFVAEVAEWLAGAAADGAARPALDFVLGDLRALLRKDPGRLARLLFAGYLYVGDALSLKHGELGDNRYARAAQALAQLPDQPLPEGTLDPLLPPPDGAAAEPAGRPREEPSGWLRRFFAFE